MCHAASQKHVLAMAETGDGSFQNGASILDAVAALSAAAILVDIQTNNELTDSPFLVNSYPDFIHAFVFFASLLGSCASCLLEHIFGIYTLDADILQNILRGEMPFVHCEKSGNLEQKAAPCKIM